MKKSVLPAIVAVTVMALSCSQPAKQALETQTEKAVTQDKFLADNIDLTHAVDLIYNFLKRGSTLKNLGQSRAIGGTFPAKDFFPIPNTDTSDGVNMWFCYNTQDIDHPVFFMSIERRSNFGSQFPDEPKPEDLIRPVNTFTYNGTIIKDSIRSYLVNDPEAKDNRVKPISSSVVKRYAKNFDSFLSLHLDSAGRKHCERMFSYFQNGNITFGTRTGNPLLDELVKQQGTTHVRYYFGYDPKEKGNRIRVILFAVGADGRNIITKTRDSGVIAQKSVPPL